MRGLRLALNVCARSAAHPHGRPLLQLRRYAGAALLRRRPSPQRGRKSVLVDPWDSLEAACLHCRRLAEGIRTVPVRGPSCSTAGALLAVTDGRKRPALRGRWSLAPAVDRRRAPGDKYFTLAVGGMPSCGLFVVNPTHVWIPPACTSRRGEGAGSFSPTQLYPDFARDEPAFPPSTKPM